MRFWKTLAVLIALAAWVWLAVCRPYSIPMGGMEPSFFKGDNVLAFKKWCDRNLRKGDFVVYSTQSEGTGKQIRLCVARIAAMPGETLLMDSTRSKIAKANGEPLPYEREIYLYNNKYDNQVAGMLSKYGFANNELLGQDGEYSARTLTKQEYEFLKRACPDDLELHAAKTETHGKTSEIIVPKKGQRIYVTPGNMEMLCQALTKYEKCTAEIDSGKLIVNGKPVAALIFGRDYYWLQSVNVTDLNDSRTCGLMPRSAFEGRVQLTLFSWSPNHGVCWDRVLRRVK